MAPSLFSESFPPKPHWNVDDIPDLQGKVYAVTGGYGGIGYWTVKALLDKGAKVYIIGRSKSKYDTALSTLSTEKSTIPIKNTTPVDFSHSKIDFIECDLGSLKSVREAARNLGEKEKKLDGLFASAGVMFPPSGSVTEDGYELQFGTNVIGHYLLTLLLLPSLQAPADSGSSKARVVFTASSGHHGAPAGCFNYDTMKSDASGKAGLGKGGMYLYGQSKIGNIVIANEFNRRYGDKVVFSSCNPGNLATDLPRHIVAGNFLVRLMSPLIPYLVYPPPLGALTQLYAATSPETAESGGKYFVPWAREGEARVESGDEEIGRKLWEWLEVETGTGK